MIKRQFIKATLRRGESLNREHFGDRACLLVLTGSMMVFDERGKPVFRLDAGDANVFDGPHELTGTAVKDDTKVIIV